MSIRVEKLAAAYGRLPVFADVTAEARAGRITTLIGPNAAGKSTLLRCVVGALRPSAGAAFVDDRPATRLGGRALAERVAYVAQRPSVAAAFSVREVVELGRYALERAPSRVDEALERLALLDVVDRPYPALSVGQQQRVAVARALAQLEPDGHLVLDEPTAAMDLRHARQCLAALRDVASGGATVLVALHDLSAAAAVADDAWLLGSSGIVVGTADEVFEVERLRGVFGVGFEWIERSDGRSVLIAVE